MGHRTEDLKFVVLVGSYARGDQTSTSDCDVLLCNVSEQDVDWSKMPTENSPFVNFVRYDTAILLDELAAGGLFLHHAFTEGRVLTGDTDAWEGLKRSYSVKTDFTDELMDIYGATALLSDTRIFGDCFLTPLVNAFSHVKNACMYALARKRRYSFNKEECIRLALAGSVVADDLCALRAFYNYSIRGLEVDLPFPIEDKQTAIARLLTVHQVVGGLCNARY